MHKIEDFSYRCGVIDAFNEMIRAGVKKIALSHPTKSRQERDNLIDFSREICEKYQNDFYVEDDPLLSDLFPISLNKNTFLLVYYKNPADLMEYLQIKKDKDVLVRAGAYSGAARAEIAVRFGKLLSYSEEGIARLMAQNTEKE